MGLAGGVETMSRNPMAWEGGINPAIEGSKKAQSCLMPMGITSENVAAKFGVDRYAYRSPKRLVGQQACLSRDTLQLQPLQHISSCVQDGARQVCSCIT